MRKSDKVMKYVKYRFVKLLFVILVVCLTKNIAEAQTLGSLYLSPDGEQAKELVIEKGLSLEEAVERLEDQFNVVFLYRTDTMKGYRVTSTTVLPNNIKGALKKILQDKELGFRYLNPKTYGIFAVEKPAKKEKEPIVEQLTGTVTDAETGETLPGVNILVKGTSTGASTDQDGQYELTVPSLQDTLIFTYIGYQRQEVPIDGQTEIDVTMQPQAITGEEMVVVGYGTQKELSVTGSVSKTPVKDIQRVATPSLSNAIGGKLPGIITRQSQGEPGYDAAQVSIRGLSTWANRNPLILVDGVERDMNNINAEEIESFTILKDASATAVYGVRGANGVILIETKRGKQGKPQITFRTERAVLTPLRIPEYINSGEYAGLVNEALENTGKPSRFTQEEVQKYRTGSSPYLYPNVDWMDVVFKDQTSQSINNLSISGGGDVARYYVNVGYTKQEGLYKASGLNDYNTNIDLNRYNFRSNVDINLAENFIVKLGLGGIIRKANYPSKGVGAIVDAINRTPPHSFPVQNPDGTPGGILAFLGSNPWGMVTQSGYKVQNRNTLQGTFTGDWDLSDLVTPGLSVRGKFAYDHYYFSVTNRPKVFEVRQYLGEDSETGEDIYQTHREEQPLGYGKTNIANRALYTEASVNYDRSFDKHSFGGLLLFNRRDYVDLTAPNSTANLPQRRQGLAGRLTYDYDDRYLLEFNVGYNGSENFPSGKRYGFFPSISGGWIVSNEKFWGVDFVNQLKLRGSYGQVGNDQIGGRRFLFLTSINRNGQGYLFGENAQPRRGFQEGFIGNSNVSWEVATKTNIGLDLELFKNKLKLQVDAFLEERDGILTQLKDVPSAAGYFPGAIPYANLGKVENKGLDGLIEINNTTQSGLFYSFRGNFTYAHNEIIENAEPEKRFPYLSGEGHPVGQPFGYVALGFFEDQAEIDNSPRQTFMSQVRPGDVKYKDLNDDGIIDTYDRRAIGYPRTPEIMYGFGGTVGYKGLDLSLHFTGAARTSLFLDYSSMFPFADGLGSWNVLREYYDNRWTPDNPDPEYPAVIDGNSPNNYRTSTVYMHDGSYMRLKNAEIGYNLPTKWIDKFNLRSLRVFVNGTNLYTWDKVDIVNPESNNGIGSYPLQQTINGGIEIEF